MDDILEFPQFVKFRDELTRLEFKLLDKADIVTVTSSNLEKVLHKRGYRKEIYVVNNGIEPDTINAVSPAAKFKKDELFNLIYFGAISEWFDFESIIRVLEEINDVKITLIGPAEVKIPKHERLEYIGPLEHEKLMGYAKNCDCFIMPFKISNLVLSVDPIKIYEYIALKKPVIAVRYPETEKFSEFVTLYDGINELIEKIKVCKEQKGLICGEPEKINQFVTDNSWDKRAEQIIDILER
jgi:glycosyltransferase involved in cell wall biosynthesis